MHYKIQNVIISGITPISAEIVREGNEQGIFNTAFPYEAMEMVVVYMYTNFDQDMEHLSNEEQIERMKALASAR